MSFTDLITYSTNLSVLLLGKALIKPKILSKHITIHSENVLVRLRADSDSPHRVLFERVAKPTRASLRTNHDVFFLYFNVF